MNNNIKAIYFKFTSGAKYSSVPQNVSVLVSKLIFILHKPKSTINENFFD